MSPSETKATLARFLNARPFRPFVLGFTGGASLRVADASDVWLMPRGSAFCFCPTEGERGGCVTVHALGAVETVRPAA